jgi:hypothetical protein
MLLELLEQQYRFQPQDLSWQAWAVVQVQASKQ